jgi:predicted RND superfamily exporter protein
VPWGALAAWVLDHRPAVAAALVALIVAAAALGLPPEIEPNLLALLPPEEPVAAALRDLHEREGGTNLVTLAFEGEDTDALLDDLSERLEASDRVAFALHDVDPDLATRIGVLQLDPADIRELSARMKGALALGPALNPLVSQRLMAMGPVAERIEAASRPDLFPGGGTAEGRLLVRPTGSSHDPVFSLALMDELEREIDAALARHPGTELKWIGGAYRHNVEDYEGIQQDLLWTSGASLLLVLSVITFAFRSWRAVLLVAIPLLAAVVLTLGTARVLVGSLNTYTSFGTAILVGLGIDFAVHLLGRYRELRAEGLALRQAVVGAWDRVGPPCATAALTSSAGFLALAAADFRGFSQLGVLLAAGLVVALGVMVVMLPLLIPTLDPDPPLLRGTGRGPEDSRSTYAVAPGLLMALVLLTGFVGATRLPKLRWEYDVSALRRDGLAYAELGDEERALARESYSPVVVRYETEAERSAAQRRVEELLARDELPHVAKAFSIESVLPSDQGARLEALRELQGLLHHPNARYLPPPLVERLLPLRDVSLAPLARDELPPSVRTLLGAASDDERLLLLPQGNMWDLREAAALEREVERAVRGRPAAGEYVALGALYRTMLRDLPIIGTLALVMVVILTAIDLRRLHWIAGAVGTLLAGLVWAGSALQVAGVRLTMFNVVGIPILLGIGVDVVIHLLHRLAEEGPGGVRRALATTGVAATISTVTTVLSFSSLTLAGNRGVRSMGLLVVIGLCTVFVASAVLLPTAWAAGWRVTGRAPGTTDR